MRREGITAVEVMVSVVVLFLAIVATSTSASYLSQVSADTVKRALALQEVENRIALVRLHPVYSGLDSAFSERGCAIPGLPGYTRTTAVSRFISAGESGRRIDLTKVTVTVEGPHLVEPLRSIVVVGAS